MSKRASVYLTDDTLKVLGADDDSGSKIESLSGRINVVAGRFAAIVAASTPELTEAEWCAIFDANNGCFMGEITPGESTMLWANVADSEPNALGEKWGINLQNLAAKMRAWRPDQSIAAVEIVAGFWRRYELPTEEALRLAGAKLAPNGTESS